MTRAPLAVWIAVVLLVAALAMPIKQRCGAPGRRCATAVDTHGYIHYYYEIEPFGVFLLEHALGSNIPLYYTSGDEIVKLQ
ncbi:hypothetical protein MB901379_04358 [Mycobacterium basiliense]|uniref:Uncharacterized protein n=1 Tax=Mycobacterium basiliense TaxID=2094119 RepID=A0A3S5D034_9MYCO|nr:hypothetical protein [Mycobacterium basiliense]VDM90749.1 hypothetical protein MB901379_04358 [Mycobacterium basiliense]